MDEWQEDRESLVDLFGHVRDDWIENDFSGWIGANRWLIYEIIGVYFLFGLTNIFGEIRSDLTKHFVLLYNYPRLRGTLLNFQKYFQAGHGCNIGTVWPGSCRLRLRHCSRVSAAGRPTGGYGSRSQRSSNFWLRLLRPRLWVGRKGERKKASLNSEIRIDEQWFRRRSRSRPQPAKRVLNIHTDMNNLNQVVCGCGIGYAVGKIQWIRIIRSFE